MRTKRAYFKDTENDPIYQSPKVTKLINRVMISGKKTIARKQVYTAFEIIKTKTKRDPLEVFDEAIESIKPNMEVRSRRVGGAAYQVPMPVRGARAFSLAIRWLVIESNKRPNKEYHTYAEKLAAEILDAAQGEGGAVERKRSSHKMAEANKAFAHFRW